MSQYKYNNAFDYFFENTGNLDKTFLLGPRETISYKDLHTQCLKLAEYLNGTVGRGQNILLLSPNSLFFITAYLAVIKSGNVAVPLNYEIEQRNLDYIQKKCESKLVFTTTQIKKKLDFGDATVFEEKDLNNILNSPTTYGGRQVAALSLSLDSLAEIIFTSGSTGEPKGVMISHKNLMANTSSILEYLHLTQADIMLVVLPFYYCYGLSLLHTHLRCGGSIVLNNMFIMLGSVIRDLLKYKCTGFAGVPSHFQIFLRKSESFKSTTFPDLRYVTQAGGKLHNTFICEFSEAFPQIQFYVMYGQTEATARLTWLPPDKLIEKMGSCGIPISGVKIKITEENGDPVKTGNIGEIAVQGDNVMQGYYKDPVATRHAIRDGWLFTGDLATCDADGYIFLKTRRKEIIKVGGRRISPKEVEEVIVAIPEVIDCVIEGILDDILGETMKATVTVRGNNGNSLIKPEEIKSWCSGRLAKQKIPQIIIVTDQAEISATGKRTKK